MTPQPDRPENRRRRAETLAWGDGWPYGLRSEAFAEDLQADEPPAPAPEVLFGMPLQTPGH